jgi:uncharacterized membrane-anchored protein
METAPKRRRFDVPYLLALVGGALVCIDYLTYLAFVTGLPTYELEYIVVGLAFGVTMLVSANFYKKVGTRLWLYVLLSSSLLSLFLFITVVSAIGSVLGSFSAIYLLQRRRMIR